MGDITLVTGCDRMRSWKTFTLLRGQVDGQVLLFQLILMLCRVSEVDSEKGVKVEDPDSSI